MATFRLFGGVLETSMSFPELRPSQPGDAPDWRLHRSDSPPGAMANPASAADELVPGTWARLYRRPGGLRLAIDDTGAYDIGDSGREITWHPAAGCDEELARLDFLGRVMSLAVHERGQLALHGSAVALSNGAVGFLAPKGSGKSTLAMAMVRAGARLLTDDTLPVHPQQAIAFPGVHNVRLWDDSAGRMEGLGESRVGTSDKHTFERMPDSSLQDEPLLLTALYELAPRQPESADEASGASVPVARERLPSQLATITLLRHAKLGALLGGAESARVFERAASLAALVPVYRLSFVHDYAHIDEVAAQLGRWHA